ncbi:MAG: VWA domain-containing protein [Clostridia bacterium]|nr:VWA domain-containing protein [Clostridia bacterium]
MKLLKTLTAFTLSLTVAVTSLAAHSPFATAPMPFVTSGQPVSQEHVQLDANAEQELIEYIVGESSVDAAFPESCETVTATAVTGEGDEMPLDVSPSAVDALFPSTMAGYLSGAYDVRLDNGVETGTLTFEGTLTADAVSPTVYYFSNTDQTLVPIETVLEDGVASATVDRAGTYILLDRALYEASLTWEDEWGLSEVYDRAEVVFVMDDSGSMRQTDAADQRLTLAASLMARLPENSRVGVVRFASAAECLTPSLVDVPTAAAFMTHTYFHSDGGTAMFTAVETALTLYSDAAYTQKVMVVLTDGLSVDTFAYASLTASIVAKGIAVHMIGYDEIPAYATVTPQTFANDVDGTYYHAADADELALVYREIGKQIDLSVDSDGDTIPDYYEDHLVAFSGVRIALDKTKADTDGDGIPDNEEVSVTLVYSEDGTKVYVKGVLLSDPTVSDTDGDGIPDGEDAAPYNNTFTGVLTSEYSSNNVSFTVDFSDFFGDNTRYNADISELSSLFSAVAYEKSGMTISDSLGKRTVNAKTVSAMMAYFGMSGTKNYVLADDYDDMHVSEVTVGYRNIVKNGELQTLLCVVVRGTNDTIEEWSSNFDIGDLAADTEDDDWTNTMHHKGFDIPATRIKRFLAAYIAEQNLYVDSLTYWVTGHSRGAAIANLIGADLEREGKRAFTYTFATPSNTLATDAASYRTIFNIINEDDFVPRLPVASWGYTRYGRSTSGISVKTSYETQWESFTGISSYKCGVNNMDARVETIGKILTNGADPRIDAYRYTCDCHGDATNDTITIRNNGMSQDSREKAIAKIPQNALPVCKITRYDGGLISGWDFEVCQTPSYFMQLVAAYMAGEIGAYRFAVELNIADRYENAKTALVEVGLEGAAHPHYAETYYLLAYYVTASDFVS